MSFNFFYSHLGSVRRTYLAKREVAVAFHGANFLESQRKSWKNFKSGKMRAIL